MQAIGTAVSLVVVLVAVFAIGSLVDYLCVPIINMFVNLSVDPLTIPFVNQIILWAQAIALSVAVIILICRGIYQIVINPSGQQVSLAEYFAKCVITIMLIILMPLLCSMIISIGTTMFTEVQGAVASTGYVTINTTPISEEWINGLENASFQEIGAAFANSILVIFVVIGACMVVYQLVKRQILMLWISVAATFVSIKAAADNYGDLADVLVSLFALCVIQIVQYTAYAVAIVVLNNFIGDVSWMQVNITAGGAILNYIVVLAFLGVALGIPAVLERFAFNSGRSGVGNLLIGSAVRGGFGSIGRAARGLGGFVGSLGGAATKAK